MIKKKHRQIMQRNKKINCLLNKKNNVKDEKKRRGDKEKVKNI